MRQKRRFSLKTVTVIGSMALIGGLVGCSPGADVDAVGSGEGRGLPVGASRDDFVAALADMDPVTLTLQSNQNPGDPMSLQVERYAEKVEDWSGGNITVDIAYGSSIAQGGETTAAVRDGRLSVGGVLASYDPSAFQATNELYNTVFLHHQTPVAGMLQATGALFDVTWRTPEIIEEWREFGVEPAIMALPGVPNGVLCSESKTELDDFEGVQTRVGGTVHEKQAAALGMTGVSLEFTEVYEALQRGIIDCSVMTLVTASVSGLIPVAPYFTIDEEVGFSAATTGQGFDPVMFEELPVEARQLLWDSLDVHIEEALRAYWQILASAVQEIDEVGGEVLPLGGDAIAVLQGKNDELLAEVATSTAFDDPEAVRDLVVDANSEWEGIIQELGYTDDDPGFTDFGTWYGDDTVDLQPFLDYLFEEVLNSHRPE